MSTESRSAAAAEYFERGAAAESSRARAAWLRGLSLDERAAIALDLLAFAETARQSTGPRPRRPLDRSLAAIVAASARK